MIARCPACSLPWSHVSLGCAGHASEQATWVRDDAEVARLRDDPALDATDGAHPAWWRGHDRAAEMLAAQRDAALADARQWRERYDAIVTAVREMLAAERAVADELLTDGSDNPRADLEKMHALRCRAYDARRALRALVEAP